MRVFFHSVIFTVALLCLNMSCSRYRDDGIPGGVEETVDLLIVNARIIDGTGNPWFRGALAVKGDRIAAVGPLVQVKASRVIDAMGKVLAPGFIDLHNHCDKGLLETPAAENFVRQGVTTLVGGPDGEGAPHMGEYLAAPGKEETGPQCLFYGRPGRGASRCNGHGRPRADCGRAGQHDSHWWSGPCWTGLWVFPPD